MDIELYAINFYIDYGTKKLFDYLILKYGDLPVVMKYSLIEHFHEEAVISILKKINLPSCFRFVCEFGRNNSIVAISFSNQYIPFKNNLTIPYIDTDTWFNSISSIHIKKLCKDFFDMYPEIYREFFPKNIPAKGIKGIEWLNSNIETNNFIYFNKVIISES